MRLMFMFKNAARLVSIIVVLMIVATVGSLLFLGIGWLLAWLSPLSLFHGVCTAIGTTVALTVIGLLIAYTSDSMREADRVEDEDAEDDGFDEDDDEEFGAEPDMELGACIIDVQAGPPQKPTVSRNAPCPCGSGRKYKHCCGS